MTQYKLNIFDTRKGEDRELICTIPLSRGTTEKESQHLRLILASYIVLNRNATSEDIEKEVRRLLRPMDLLEVSYDIEEIIIDEEIAFFKKVYEEYRKQT
jgi:hypothetical protein